MAELIENLIGFYLFTGFIIAICDSERPLFDVECFVSWVLFWPVIAYRNLQRHKNNKP
jgi:hypothetical protein